ncbi:MAG: phage scaffolding protein [Burkholderiales bacterium]|nr:phage scaffolding protein [Burkholderiales bacterium]
MAEDQGNTPAAQGNTSDNPLLTAPIETIPAEWQDQARKLRSENASLRDRLKSFDDADAQAKLDDAIKKARDDAGKDFEKALVKERDAANGRLIRSELKAALGKAGLVDADAIKLVDTSKLTVSDDGDVVGIDALVADMQKAKPYLFQAPGSSSTAAAPGNGAPAPVDAKALAASDPKAYDAAMAAAVAAAR